jgi:hypothetical protein
MPYPDGIQIRTVTVNAAAAVPVYPAFHCNSFRIVNYSADLLYVYSDPNDDNTRFEVDVRNYFPPFDMPVEQNKQAPRFRPDVPAWYVKLAAGGAQEIKTISG